MKIALRILFGIICSPVLIPVCVVVVLPVYVLTGEWMWEVKNES